MNDGVHYQDGYSPEWVDKHFKVKVDAANELTGVRYVSAEAGTGYRYTVVVTRLPLAGQHGEGGPMLVTVTSPWVDAAALQASGHLEKRSVVEHLCGGPGRRNSDADIHAITLLVRHALGR